MDMSKYNSDLRNKIAQSQELALGLKHQSVEPEHLLLVMTQSENIAKIFSQFKLPMDEAKDAINIELAGFAESDSGTRYIAPRFLRVLSAAEALSARMGSKAVSASHVLVALADPENFDGSISRLFKGKSMTKERVEDACRAQVKAKVRAKERERESTELDKYTVDLVEQANNGDLGPIIGRDEEIHRVIQILSRKSKNNPVLIGPPGVGKSAVIEALAMRIANNDVPFALKNKRILTLDLGSILAGATLRGQFEERIKMVVNEVKNSDGEIILFVDEIHTMVAAGGDGASNASNMLKPALARGDIQVLGATTPEEYKNSIEKDKALERRFQAVDVDEPNEEEATRIIRGIKKRFEVHHGVRIQDPALTAAVSLAKRYIPRRHLPDKAIDLIDEAASKLRIQIDSMPKELDLAERSLTHLKMELRALGDDDDADTLEHKARLEEQIRDAVKRGGELRNRWQEEVGLIQKIRALTEELENSRMALESAERKAEADRASDIKYGSMQRLQKELDEAIVELEEVQRPGRLIKEEVGPEDIAEVVGNITGIPVNKMMESEREKLLQMESRIGERVIGQREAIAAIAKAIRRSRVGLSDPKRPVGSFFFLGPTGVGKTELAKAITQFLFDDEENLIRLDMSEFMEKHTVARLIGAPPGYKGADEGGQLTEAVRRKPYSVVLFDEVEKAHPDIFNILLQILDDGRLTDSQSNLVDFRNTVIIMTSNIGSSHLLDASDENGDIEPVAKEKAMEDLRRHFRPEFLGRIDEVIMFHGLTRGNIEVIADLQIKSLKKLLSLRKLGLELTPEAKKHVVDAGFDPRYGARPLRRAIQNHLQDPLSTELLNSNFPEGSVIKTDLDVEKEQLVFSRA